MAIRLQIEKKLEGFQLEVSLNSEGRRIGILGASGCGKSMTLKSIAGIEKPDSGFILVDDVTLYDSDRHFSLKTQKRRVGYLFQNYALFPTMTVWENIGAGVPGKRKEKEKTIEGMLEKFQLKGLEKRFPAELSGGQQQRVALARIMAYEPEVILLDEPFSALDGFLKDKLQQEIQEILADYKGTVILVSHSRDEIYRFSEELLILHEGKSICQGKTKELFENPQWKEAARLTGCKNIVKAEKTEEHKLWIPEWKTELLIEREIPEDIAYIGFRAHDFIPVWGERCKNSIPVQPKSIAELPFERKYFLEAQSTSGEEICWFVQREKWPLFEEKGLPDWLLLPEEKILLLRE